MENEERDSFGRTGLHYAVLRGDLDLVEELLGGGADPTTSDRSGLTPLHFAAQEQVAQAVPVLIAAGAAVDVRDSWGNTPLWRAVFNSNGGGETIQALLAAGADPDSSNDSDVSPRQLAERIGNYDVWQFL